MNEQIESLFRNFAKIVAEEVVKLNTMKADIKNPSENSEEGRTLYRGLDGICKIFHCAKTRAFQIKKSGIIDDAIIDISPRMFLVDSEKAIECYKKADRNKRRTVR